MVEKISLRKAYNMSSRTLDETLTLLHTLVAADIQDAGLKIGFDPTRVKFVDAAELNTERSRLIYEITLGENVSVALRHCWDNVPLSRRKIDDEVEVLMDALRALDAASESLVTALEETRAEAEQEARRCRDLDLEVSVHDVRLDFMETHFGGTPSVIVTFNQLGHSLQSVRESFEIDEPQDLRGWFGGKDDAQGRFLSLREEVAQEGADGVLDLSVFFALIQNGIDPYAEIRRNMNFRVEDAAEGAEGPIMTGFYEGTFTGIFALGRDARYVLDRVWLDFPEPIDRKLEKRLVSEIIEHRYVLDDLRFISDRVCTKGSAYHSVQPVLYYFNLTKRRIWPRTPAEGRANEQGHCRLAA